MERAMFCVRCACGRGCHPVGGCAKLFFPPFWSRTAHIVIFRVVSPVRSVPGRTEKRHQSADAAAQKRNKNRCSERKLSHVTLHGKMSTGDRTPNGPYQSLRTRLEPGLRVTQSLLARSKRIPRSSSSRSIRRSFELAIASIILCKKPLKRLKALRTRTRLPRVLPNRYSLGGSRR